MKKPGGIDIRIDRNVPTAIGSGERLPRYWPEFLDSVRISNEYLQPMVLRRYQVELLDQGEFCVISPFSGERVVARRSAMTRRQQAYYFPEIEPFWLLIQPGSISFGYPISDLLIRNSIECIHLWRRPHVFNSVAAEDYELLMLTTRSATEMRTGTRAALVAGHENFAHHLWNELSALDSWLQSADDALIAATSAFFTCEPLGSLRELFPRLSAAGTPSRQALQALPLRVRLGGQRVTPRVRSIVRGRALERANAPRIAVLADKLMQGKPRVWISVRQGSRTPDNQAEFLAAVIAAILRANPDASFVLDGFSFPVGFSTDSRIGRWRALFRERAAIDKKLVDSLLCRIEDAHGCRIRGRFCSTTGLDVLDAMCVASFCTFYVCHAGTLQHKIGWIHDIPGLVHTSPNDHKYARWCTNFVENAIMPEFLPAELCIATGPPVHKQDIPRNYNYRITDVIRAAEVVADVLGREPDCFQRGTGIPIRSPAAAHSNADAETEEHETISSNGDPI